MEIVSAIIEVTFSIVEVTMVNSTRLSEFAAVRIGRITPPAADLAIPIVNAVTPIVPAFLMHIWGGIYIPFDTGNGVWCL